MRLGCFLNPPHHICQFVNNSQHALDKVGFSPGTRIFHRICQYESCGHHCCTGDAAETGRTIHWVRLPLFFCLFSYLGPFFRVNGSDGGDSSNTTTSLGVADHNPHQYFLITSHYGIASFSTHSTGMSIKSWLRRKNDLESWCRVASLKWWEVHFHWSTTADRFWHGKSCYNWGSSGYSECGANVRSTFDMERFGKGGVNSFSSAATNPR